MEVLPFKIPKVNDHVILFQNDRNKLPYNRLHQHEEYQITLVEEGNGTMIVGDSFKNFQAGEIFLFGSHLPHVFNSGKTCSMVSLFFTDDTLGAEFFQMPQLDNFQSVLNLSGKGLRIESLRTRITELIYACERNKNSHKVISFLQLLQAISDCDKSSLSNYSYNRQFSPNEGKRMTAIFDYVMNNYMNNIRLEKVADLAMMSKNAFCKYFKLRTNKTFFEFLIEVRIERACDFLINKNNVGIEEIVQLVGFNNQSNFNRHFRRLKGESPREFRNKIANLTS